MILVGNEPGEGVCSLQSGKAAFRSTAKFFGQTPAAKMKNKQFCCSAKMEFIPSLIIEMKSPNPGFFSN